MRVLALRAAPVSGASPLYFFGLRNVTGWGVSERAALVLSGGGARAAYQVGVLWAIRELWGARKGNPFPILCGTSAGALNAVTLAVHAENFNAGVRRLAWTWRHFHVHHVYRADTFSVLKSALTWGSTLAMGWLLRRSPRSLLDNSPLRTLLTEKLDFGAIAQAIEHGALHAVSVTCSGYTSGESLSFYQGAKSVVPWRRAARVGFPARLTPDHLLASSAIPFVFPAVKIHREFFGDGSMRQLAPISPAVHLGATRVLVIGAGRPRQDNRRVRGDRHPSLAQIAGHAMSSIFLDGLTSDLESLARINGVLDKIPADVRETLGVDLKPIETLVISPSERLESHAVNHFKSLPWAVRVMLRGIGAGSRSGAMVLSYLLFEPPFARALIDLGYRDAMARRSEIEHFLRIDQSESVAGPQTHAPGFGGMSPEAALEAEAELFRLSS